MSNADEGHFDDYRPQTRTKHKILSGYLKAFLIALKNRTDRLAYVDGFAGRGKYRDGPVEYPGSPLLALDVLVRHPPLRSKVDVVLIEKRSAFFDELTKHVDEFCKMHPEVPRPMMRHGKFTDCYRPSLGDAVPAATFLFVDPCGVDDVDMATIAAVLKQPMCELFLFFNSNGIKRIASAASTTGRSQTLDALLGSPERTERMVEAVRTAAGDLDGVVLDEYQNALRAATRVRYILPFRMEAADRLGTSHYLIHACNDCLGFKIMKHVMLDAATQDADAMPSLEYAPASKESTPSLFGVESGSAEEDVLEELQHGPRPVGGLVASLVCRPTDFYGEQFYKRLLCDLEARDVLAVFEDAACTKPKPREKRLRLNPKTKIKQPTLGDPLWLKVV